MSMVKYYLYKRIYGRKDENKLAKYEITAYTDDKKIAKLFESQRNMDLYKKKIIDLSSDGIRMLLEEHPNALLSKMSIKIIDREHNEKYKIKFALSRNEISNYNSRIVMVPIELYTHAWNPPEIFNDEIYDALKTLGYVDIHREVGKRKDEKEETGRYDNKNIFKEYLRRFDFMNKYSENLSKDDIFVLDEYGILFSIIGDTLK